MTRRGLYPERIGPYQIQGLIAEGGMSLVLAAEAADGRKVAIKLAEIRDERGRQRFQREINACRRLSHPGIIRILSSGEYQGRPWYAMDHHGEVTLREVIDSNGPGVANELPALVAAIQNREIFSLPAARRRLLPRSAVVELVIAIGDAVAHAHARGLVHRDLKPENVLLQPSGRPVVVDFGLVADAADLRRLTQTNKVVGTMGYLAPEQFHGQVAIDERVDVYALGMLLRELLTGQTPSDDPLSRPITVAMRTTGHLRSRDAGERPLERSLSLVLFRATHPDPRRRYRSMQAFLADLERVQRGERVLARPDPVWRRVGDRLRRRAAVSSMVAIAVALMLIAALVATANWRIDDLAWAKAVTSYDLRQAQAVRELRTLSGQWVHAPEGLTALTTGTLATREPVPASVQIEAQVVIRSSAAPGSVFAAASVDGDRGYQLTLGCEDYGPTELSRDGVVVAQSGRRFGPGLHTVRWVLDDGVHAVTIDGDELLVWRDDRPLPGGWLGLRQPSGSRGDAPVWQRLALRPLGLRGPSTPQRELGGLLGALERLPAIQRAPMASAVDELVAAASHPDAALRRIDARWLVHGAADPQVARQLQLELDHIPGAQRDEHWRHMHQRLIWDPDSVLGLTATWRDPAQRSDHDTATLWRLRLAQEQRDHRLLALVWDGLPAAASLSDAYVAERVMAALPWDAERRVAALALAASDGGHRGARAAAHWWWLQRFEVWDEVRPATSPDPVALARLEVLVHLVRDTPVSAVSPRLQRLIALIRGQDPSARFDRALAADTDLLSARDRIWLDRYGSKIEPPSSAWADPMCSQPAVAAQIVAAAAGRDSWQSVADAAMRAGASAELLPWHRLVLPCLDGDANQAQRLGARLLVANQGLDALAAGWVCDWRLLGVPDPASVAACGPELAELGRALADQAPPPPDLHPPGWHPSRPLLELVLALHAHRHGDHIQARNRLQRLATEPTWPEGLVAAGLLQRPQTE